MRADVNIKMVLWIAVAVILMSSLAAAQYMPLYVGGKLAGTNVGYLGMTMTNLRSGAAQHTVTNGGGGWAFDAANFAGEPRYIYGDSFKIVVDVCAGNPVCELTVTYTGQKEISQRTTTATVMDLSGITILPTCRECPDCDCGHPICGACPTCEACAACPDCAECDVCGECEVCGISADLEPCEERPDDLAGYLMGLAIVGALAVVGYLASIKIGRYGEDALSMALATKMSNGSGIRAYESKDKEGNERVLIKHLHKGITGYHSPDILHTKPEVRHEKGKLIV